MLRILRVAVAFFTEMMFFFEKSTAPFLFVQKERGIIIDGTYIKQASRDLLDVRDDDSDYPLRK